MKQDDIIDIASDVTEKELREYAVAHTRTDRKPRHLRPNEILVADKVFQRRDMTVDIGNRVRHAQEFIRTLRELGKPLEPVTVVPIGDRFYLVDGHYRMTAYLSTKWLHSIPVRVLDCDLDGAWMESLRLNVKHGRPMTLEDKGEAAWRLVKAGKMLRPDIVKETMVSRSTVGTMRRTLAELKEAGQNPADMTWKEALSGRPHDDLDPEAFRAKAVAELQRKLLGALGPGIERRADYLAEAISLAYPKLPGALVPHWPEAMREAQEDREAFESLDI